jgi:hypothetical protein
VTGYLRLACAVAGYPGDEIDFGLADELARVLSATKRLPSRREWIEGLATNAEAQRAAKQAESLI